MTYETHLFVVADHMHGMSTANYLYAKIVLNFHLYILLSLNTKLLPTFGPKYGFKDFNDKKFPYGALYFTQVSDTQYVFEKKCIPYGRKLVKRTGSF